MLKVMWRKNSTKQEEVIRRLCVIRRLESSGAIKVPLRADKKGDVRTKLQVGQMISD